MHILWTLSDGFGMSDIALLLNRLGVGVFFAISGYHKLFNKDRHALLVATLLECHVPFLKFNQWFVPAVEFLGGLAVISGLFAPLAAFGMVVILAIAIKTDGAKRLAGYKPIDSADWYCDVLYLPESLYMIMLAVVIIAGPGLYSLHQGIAWYWAT